MNWILLAYIYWNGPATIAQRFPNQASCEQAKDWIKKNGWGVVAVCLEDKK
jgi:hypothetical protein